MGGTCSTKWRSAYGRLVRKDEGKRLLGRPRYSWEENIKTNLKEIGYEGVEWFHQAQDRDHTVMNLWRIYCPVEQLLASKDGLCTTEVVSMTKNSGNK
jgi:hypothetical protein